MNDAQRTAAKKAMLSMWRNIAERFNPDDLPADEAWKNDLNAIADGIFDNPPKSVGDLTEVQRYMMLHQIEAEMAAEKQIEKEGAVDLVMPETLIDLMAQGAGLMDPARKSDRSKINLIPKKDVN